MPSTDGRISIGELRQAFELLITHLRQTAGDEISLERDVLWAVPPAAMYDVSGRPSELTIGQLSESWAHVRRVIKRGESELAYELVWFADVLRAIGHQQIS